MTRLVSTRDIDKCFITNYTLVGSVSFLSHLQPSMSAVERAVWSSFSDGSRERRAVRSPFSDGSDALIGHRSLMGAAPLFSHRSLMGATHC